MPEDFDTVYAALLASIKPFEHHLAVVQDKPGTYSLNTRVPWRGKDLYFGGVVTRKNYVSYYLMGVYMYPDLLDGISGDLRKRMQGKSCFNFRSVEPSLLEELGALTKKTFQRMKAEGNV